MAIAPIKGFYVHDEETNTDGVAKVSIEAVQEFEDDIRDETSKWLDDHPDATTTVEDGAITEPKINPSFLQSIKNAYVTPEQFGAVGDGVADDTNAFNRAFANSKYVYVPAGTYLINADSTGWGHLHEGGVQVPSGAFLLMDADAILKANTNTSGFYAIINLHNADNVTIQGGQLIGERDAHSATGGEYGHGIRISECNNVLINGVNISDTWGDGVCIASANESTGNNKFITLKNMTIDHVRRNGVSVVIGEQIVIDNCEIVNTSGTAPQAGIDIESSADQHIGLVTIRNSVIKDNATSGIVCERYADNVVIQNTETQSILGTKNAGIIRISDTDAGAITCGADNTYIDRTRLNFLNVQGGNVIVSNSDITGDDGDNLIFSGVDNMSSKISEYIKINNCKITGSLSTKYLFYGGYTGNNVPEKNLEFENCKIDISKSNTSFLNRMPANKLKIVNSECKMQRRYQVFTSSTIVQCKAEIIGCTFNEDANHNYLFSIDGAKTLEIILANNVIAYERLAYCGAASDGYIIRNGNVTSSSYPDTVVGGQNTVQVIATGNSS